MHETFEQSRNGSCHSQAYFPPKIRKSPCNANYSAISSPFAVLTHHFPQKRAVRLRSLRVFAISQRVRAKGLSRCRKSPCEFHFIYISPAGPPDRKIPPLPPPVRPSVRPSRSPFRRRPAFYLPPALLDGVSTSKRAPRGICRAL